MPARIENIGGKAMRYALPVTVTLGALCFAATNENQSNGKTEPAQAAAEIHLSPETSGAIGKNVMLLSGLRSLPEGGWRIGENLLGYDLGKTFLTPNSKPQAAPKSAAAPTTYTVQPGDSFFKIAQELKVDPFNLIEDNHMKPWETLDSGKVLRLPKPGEAPAPPEPLTPPVQLDSYYSGWASGASQSSSGTHAAAVASGYHGDYALDAVTVNTPDWQCIRIGESGQNGQPRYYIQSGAYGFLTTTAEAYFGTWNAGSVSPAAQDAAALAIFHANGDKFSGAWSTAAGCGLR